ncbi:MAG TPA: hypothetical protein PLS66_03555, partial [Tepiditoga sp.]|nr:hypothetical protein [Tepiditoga sp.]
MQVSIEQIINIIMAKLETVEMTIEDLKFKNNIALRLLRENNLLTEDNLKKAVKDEYNTMLELESKENGENIEITDEQIDGVVKNIIQWVDNDLEDMKKKINDYQKKMEEMMKNQQGPDISV